MAQTVHGGKWALRIERNDKSEGAFTAVNRMIPIDFAGESLELRGFLRTEDVSDFAGLWMREDGDSGSVAFDNMQRRQLKGTTEWTEYSIKLPLEKSAKRLIFGVLAAGVGKVWADDIHLLVDGRPLEGEPRIEQPKTVLDLDKEFDAGSGIALKSLTKIQIDNLAMLGKIWGFLKYHHPIVTAGKRHWDYELFPHPAASAGRGRRGGRAIRRAAMGGLTRRRAGLHHVRESQRKRSSSATAR